MTAKLFRAAKKHIAGGVNSPVRAFMAVAGIPVFFKKAHGAYLYDTEGRKYIDYVGSWGPMILGHAHPEVVRNVQKSADRKSTRLNSSHIQKSRMPSSA